MLREIWQARHGLILVLVVGLLSWGLAQWIPRLGAVTIGILLGVVIGNLIPNMTRFNAGGLFAEKRLLPLAIVCLGVELQLSALVDLGATTAVAIAATILTAIGVSLLLARWFGYAPEFALLIGAGNGICGSSAVAAVAVSLKAKQQEVGISVGVVNLLGVLGIFFIPFIASALALDATESGILVGASLQAVGQVVAAGYSIGETVGALAVVVKMGRVLMLGPLVVLISTLARRRDAQAPSGVMVPWFIVGFLVMSLLASGGIFAPTTVSLFAELGRFLLIFSMVGIGLRIQFRALFRFGIKAFAFGMLVSSAQVLVILLILWLS